MNDLAALKEQLENKFGVNVESRDREWDPAELQAVAEILSALPDLFVRDNPNLKSLVRESTYTGDVEEAPGGGMYRAVAGPDAKKDYIVLYDKGLRDINGNLDVYQLSRALIHELSHSLDDELEGPYREWLELSGWFQDNGKWLASRDAGFLNDYSRNHPKEDFAECFTAYVMQPDRLKIVAPLKYLFMEKLFEQGQNNA